MKLPGLKLNKKEAGSSLSHAFGASGQTREEILGSTYVPPPAPTAAEKAGAVFSGLKEKAAGLASQVHIPGANRNRQEFDPGQLPPEDYAQNGYAPEGYIPEGSIPPAGHEMPRSASPVQEEVPRPASDGWYNPFTDPAPPPVGYGYAPPAYGYGSQPGYGYQPEYAPQQGYAYQPDYAPQQGYAYQPEYAPQQEYAYQPEYAPRQEYDPQQEDAPPSGSAPRPESTYAPPSGDPALDLPEDPGVPPQPIFNMNGEIIAYAPPYFDQAGNLLGYAQPCFDANGQLVGFAPPSVVGQSAPTAPRAGKASSGDLRFLLWAGSILAGMVLTLVSFVYACAI